MVPLLFSFFRSMIGILNFLKNCEDYNISDSLYNPKKKPEGKYTQYLLFVLLIFRCRSIKNNRYQGTALNFLKINIVCIFVVTKFTGVCQE